jgi:hypothetical protein
MAFTSSVSNLNVEGAYFTSFGNLPSGTKYYDPMDGIDMKASAELVTKNNPVFKALNTESGGSGTAGYALIPVFVDPRLVDRTRKETPLSTLLPRVTNRGITADYIVITAKGGAFTAAEDASLSETTTTYDRGSKSIKYLYAIGRVTGQAIAAVPGYNMDSIQGTSEYLGSSFGSAAASNALQQEVLVKTREIKELEENLLINGDSTTSGVSGNPDGTEFDGIISLQSTTNQKDLSSAALTLGDIDAGIKLAYDDGGRPNIAICDSSTYTDLLGLLNNKIGYMQAQVETQWGFTAIKLNTMVGQVTVIPSRFMTTVSGSKQMYFLDTSVIEVRVLQDLTYEDLAKTSDARKFMLKEYITLINRAPAFCSFIDNIA